MFRLRTTPLTWLTPLTIGLAAAYAVSGALPGRLDEATPRAAPTAAAPERPAPTSDVVLQKNILGLRAPAPESVANGAPAASSAQAAGVDPADWPLLGVIAGSRSGALILADNEVRLVSLHDEFKGWELAEASGETAVWTSGAQRREVVMRQDKASQPKPETQAEGAPGGEGRREKFTLDKEEAAKLLVDPNAILQQARFSPNQTDGKVDGFRISSIRADSVFARMGMQNGDVLLSVNGEQIDNPEKLLRVYSGLKSAQAVNLNLRRQGQVQSILVDLR